MDVLDDWRDRCTSCVKSFLQYFITCAAYPLYLDRYFLPEDGDTEDAPNVFLAPKSTRAGYPPLLGQVKNSFPLPGRYHFRFKTALVPGSDRDKNAVAVWMDCVDDSEPVPAWQNSVVAKVTRVTVADDEESYNGEFDRVESNVSTGGYSSSRSSIPSSKPEASTNYPSQHSSDSLLGGFDDPPAPAPTNTAPAAHASSGNLLDDHHPPAPPTSGGSLLDMDHIASSGSVHNSSGANTPTPHDELLNMTAPMPSKPAQGATAVRAQYPPQQQQGSMHGQYPMQGGMGGMMPPQQGMGMQQHFHQSRGTTNATGGKNAFDKFSGTSLDPLGNLKWS